MKFDEFDLDDELLDALDYMGYTEATPVQEATIPAILSHRDVIACAQTGTGKTAAFLLPILNKLISGGQHNTGALIIVPTRELALQIEQQIQGLTYFIPVSSIAVYGGGDGRDFDIQKEALMKGTDIVVATPGKLLSHLQLGYVDFSKVTHLVLDEADRMLDMGFSEDIQLISTFLPVNRQNLLFSATMPESIRKLARRILKDPVEINLAISKPAEGVDQKLYLVYNTQKEKLLAELLRERKHYDSIIIFTSAKSRVSEIVHALGRSGFPAKGISSNLEQDQREEVLREFKSRKIRILVATDVMSRGIDIKEINLVINFDVPHDAEDYVHRVGRTARANTKGEAITLVNPDEMYRAAGIESLIGASIPRLKLPESIGDGPTWNPLKPKPTRKGKAGTGHRNKQQTSRSHRGAKT